MDSFPWGFVLTGIATTVSLAIPVIFGLWEFVFKGRRRLGYRVQMDTLDKVEPQPERALPQNGDSSFVLLRVDNNGITNIDTADYAVLDEDKIGIRVRFPGRRVAGMVVTELSDEFLRYSFGEDSGLNAQQGTDVVELPRVPLNRSQHYKVLVALVPAPENAGDHQEQAGSAENARGTVPALLRRFRALTGRNRRSGNAHGDQRRPATTPWIVAGVKGGVKRGGIRETQSRTRTSRLVIVLIAFLVAANLIQLGGFVIDSGPPLDCATGRVTLTGSTAFEPTLRAAAESYEDTCPEANFTIETQGSIIGLRRLTQAGRSSSGGIDMLAFSDGETDDFAQLLPRPIAVSFFTLVINAEAGVPGLSLQNIRRIYRGEITNWSDVGGSDLPIRLVGRDEGSGTRKTLETRILGGGREPDANSGDCERAATGGATRVVRCERDTTEDVLEEVERIPGALGYGELQAATATGRQGLRLLQIDGQQATPENVAQERYPFWQTEYAYTFGEPRAGSLTAGFLRYLTNEVGQEIVRSHGHRPCSELLNPTLCNPSEQGPAQALSPRPTP